MSEEGPRRREKASEISDVPRPEDGGRNGGSQSGSGDGTRRRTRRRKPSASARSQAARTKGSGAAVKNSTAEPPGEKERGAEPPGEKERSPTAGGRTRSRRGRRRSPRTTRPPVERTMLVHADPRGTQIGVIEGGEIVEHYVARSHDRSLVGNVYLGRVQNVLPGMEASFVDIGEARNGVLYAGEVGIAGDEGDEVPRIETVLKSGQPILVQVTKDPMRSKGARLTALVSIAGRHLVLVPNAGSVGVSRRLPEKERTRLRDIAGPLRPGSHGLIVRTAAEGAARADVERDLARLVETWEEISGKASRAKAPELIYEEPELELRVIRDLFNREITQCVVDDPSLESMLRTYVRQTTPDLDHRLELYEGELPIFEEFRVAEQIRKSLDRRVWLPSGGHIVIDRTEAMTVIDVNTGKFVGKSTLEETVLRTNKEAVIEVARQLRLRDIGGIIVVDFIDMEITDNRDEVIRLFRSELDRDRTRTQVFDISPLGLVQMTRKNVSTGIVEAFSDPCDKCEGRGILIHDLP